MFDNEDIIFVRDSSCQFCLLENEGSGSGMKQKSSMGMLRN